MKKLALLQLTLLVLSNCIVFNTTILENSRYCFREVIRTH